MKKNRLFTTICLMAAILFTACTQDELAEQGNTLPEGEYPLQIGSVSITAESSEEPWTRVAENETDGMGSHWTGGERIGVRIGDNEEMGIYIIKVDDAGNVTVTPETPVYWKNTQTAEVTAWYPAEDGNVYLSRQDRDGLTYVLRGTGTGNHQSPVTLQFEHQLAKVRVVTKGTAEVWNMEIDGLPMDCTIEEGEITSVSPMTDRIPMRRTTYQDGTECWEANVVPGIEIKAFQITIPIDGSVGTYYGEWGSTVTPEAGKLSTITLAVHRKGTTTIDLSTLTGTREINDNGTYYVTGTGSYGIKVTNGNPNIYLEDAQISVSSGNAIDITGGNPTIHVMGDDNEVSSSDGAGIYVAENFTVTIQGSSRSDELTATGNSGGAGIGGYSSGDGSSANVSCGNIHISKVTIRATGSKTAGGNLSPGIGGAGNASCGTITIDDATIYAYGLNNTYTSSPAIGGGISVSEQKGAFGTITIRNNSEVYVQRGNSYSDYIGYSGSLNNPATGDIIATKDETSEITTLN